jgi:hypothetical protein
MANIDRIASVVISLKTAGVHQQTFSDLLLSGVHGGPNRIDIITDADDLLDASQFPSVTTTHRLYKAAQVAFAQTPGPRQVYIGRRDNSEAIDVALAAMATTDNNWYGFSDVSHAEADLTLAAAWAEANSKIFLTCLSNPNVAAASGSEPATALKVSQFFRTAWWYNPDPAQFPEVAIAAKMFTKYPGQDNWANQRLSSVTSPPLTETAFHNITNKNGNTFEPFRNISITQTGMTAGGEWIDIIRFRDWLCEEIRTQVFDALIDTRLPYTDSGIAVIRQQIVRALDLGVRRGGIAPRTVDPANPNTVVPSYTVIVPAASEVSFSDKAARILRDVTFTARLAGALNVIYITGVLTYSDIG